MSRVCLTQVLYAEVNPKKPMLRCCDCPMRDGCQDQVKIDEKERKKTMTLIDRDPLIKEYDKALAWLQEHIDELSCEEYSERFASVMMAKTMLMNAPAVGDD